MLDFLLGTHEFLGNHSIPEFIIGYLFEKLYRSNLKLKVSLFLILFILVTCILVTGERSNGIKAIIGLLIFLFLNGKVSFKTKISIFRGFKNSFRYEFHFNVKYGNRNEFSRLSFSW